MLLFFLSKKGNEVFERSKSPIKKKKEQQNLKIDLKVDVKFDLIQLVIHLINQVRVELLKKDLRKKKT